VHLKKLQECYLGRVNRNTRNVHRKERKLYLVPPAHALLSIDEKHVRETKVFEAAPVERVGLGASLSNYLKRSYIHSLNERVNE